MNAFSTSPVHIRSQQSFDHYNNNNLTSAWDNSTSVLGLQMNPDEDDTMDETDWDYLISLGIGPSCTTEDPSGTALLRRSIANTSQSYDQQIIDSERMRAAKTSKKGVIMIPPLMPRTRVNPQLIKVEQDLKSTTGMTSTEGDSPTVEDTDIKSDPDGDDKGLKKRKKMKSIDPKDMTEEQLVERR